VPLLAEELGRSFELEVEDASSGRYVLKVRLGADPAPVLERIAPLAPPIERDAALDVDYELHLDDAGLARKWQLLVQATTHETLLRTEGLAADLGLDLNQAIPGSHKWLF